MRFRGQVLAVLLCLAFPVAAAPLKLAPGSPVPELSRSDFNGKPVDLAAWRGQVVLIDFWASWCAPCITQMPHLIGLQRRFGAQGLKVVGISMDDSTDAAKAVAHRFAFNYPLVLGDAKLGSRFGGVLGLPVQMLVARDGKIRNIWRGEVPPAEVEQAVKAALR